MKNQFVIYTALFGDYDNLIEPITKFENCDFICFTDQNIKSDIWKIIKVGDIDLPLNMMNRKYKILPHIFLSDYTKSLYIDANIKLLSNPAVLADKYLKNNDIAIPTHKDRNCIYKESIACVVAKKSTFNQTFTQMLRYKNYGYPLNHGLTENHIIFRNHHSLLVIKTMDNLWAELNSQTQRDQLSLLYCAWNNGLHVQQMNETAWDNSNYFSFISHKNYLHTNILIKIFRKIEMFYREVLFKILFKYKYKREL